MEISGVEIILEISTYWFIIHFKHSKLPVQVDFGIKWIYNKINCHIL